MSYRVLSIEKKKIAIEREKYSIFCIDAQSRPSKKYTFIRRSRFQKVNRGACNFFVVLASSRSDSSRLGRRKNTSQGAQFLLI